MTGSGHLRGVVAACLGVVAALLPAFAFEVHAQPITRVYRADWRPPAEMFQHGAQGRGTNMDLLAHALGGSCDDPDPARGSLWVSTVVDFREAERFARDQIGELFLGTVPDPTMWVYTIRPDDTYISLPGFLARVATLAEEGREGYSIQHARDLRHVLQNTLVRSEEEVVTHYIAPGQIESAVPVHYDQRNEWVVGARVANPGYVHAQTSVGVDGDVRLLVPPGAIARYAHPGAGASASCRMTCDRSHASSSRMHIGARVDSTLPSDCSAALRGKSNTTPLLQQVPAIFDFFGSGAGSEEL